MPIFKKIRKSNGKRLIYFCGIKIGSYTKAPKNIQRSIYAYQVLHPETPFSIKNKENNEIIAHLNQYMHATENTLNFEFYNKDIVQNETIWQLWLQGENNMPDIVKFCTNSVKRQNATRKVVLVTEDNLDNYIKIPDYIIEKYKKGFITKTHYSDLIRLFLLCKYGGIWVDATIYMTDKIPEYIINATFCVPKDLTASLIKKDTTLEQFVLFNEKAYFVGPFTNSISFIRYKKGHDILENSLKVMLEYWKNETSIIHYLFFSYFLTLVIFNDQKIKELFINSPDLLTTVQYGYLQKFLGEPYDETLFNTIAQMTSIHKLTYKFDSNYDKNSFVGHFINQV